MNTNDQENANLLPSKSSIKKSMLELQKLGEELVNLSPNQFKLLLKKSSITLNDSTNEAILLARRLKSGNALRRQIQLIGKLLREEDHKNLNFYVDKFQHINNLEPSPSELEHDAKQWLDRLTNNDTFHEALSNFITNHPSCDRQQLNQLLRNTRKSTKDSGAAIQKLKDAIKVTLQEQNEK